MMVEVCGLGQYCFGFTIYLGCQLQRDENEMAKKLLFGQYGFTLCLLSISLYIILLSSLFTSTVSLAFCSF
jgi:hypothetical protein